MTRKRVASASVFESEIGFSRAVRLGPMICVSGTAPIGADGKTAHPGSAYKQTLRCLEIVKAAVEEAGGRLDDVVRTRVLLTDISQWPDAAKAHREIFSHVQPACTFFEVSRLIDPAWLVEIEADAYLGGAAEDAAGETA